MSLKLNRSLTLVVLDTYFDEVVLLESYLREILAPSSCGSDTSSAGVPFLVPGNDSQEYEDLLKTSYVGLSNASRERPCFAAVPPLMYMRDVGSHPSFA
jgi:hypothetical protein